MEDQNLQPNPSENNASQPTVMEPASQTQNIPVNQPKPRHSKLIIFAVLGIILALGLILGGNYVLNSKTSNKPTPLGSPKPTAPAASPTPDQTANWQTYAYKNASFKYPSDWEVVFDSKVANQPNGFSLHVQRKGSTGFQPDELNIDTSGVNSNYTLNSARHFTKTDRGDDSFKFEENGTMVYSSCAFYKLGQPTIDICNQIISTFKFTDSTSSTDTSTWKTYSSLCNFTVNYPENWKAVKFFIEDHESSCAYLTATDYSLGLDSRTGFYIEISRIKLGTKGTNLTISSLEDYIKDNESIMTPRISVGEKTNKTYGALSGISYLPVGFEPGRSFIFIKNGFLYDINWSDKKESNHLAEINEIIKSLKFTQ